MLHTAIEQRLHLRVLEVLPDASLDCLRLRPCADTKFGDYQANGLMTLAKERKQNPRQLAEEVLLGLDVADLCSSVEIAGAGFLNFRLKTEAVAQMLVDAQQGDALFVAPASHPRRFVVDFSSPNVAKPMHVGHIRSTILGDAIARTLRRLGHTVITDNHIGDWGTQFGKLLIGWKTDLDRAALDRDPLVEMGRLYKLVNARFEADDVIKGQARQELVKLQDGDAENLACWREMIELSLREFDKIYQRLGVRFDHVLGESFYNPQLKGVVQALVDAGLARESEGAIVVFFEDIPELKENPALIQKNDGAANYTTTDLATLAYRRETFHPDEVVYVTDGRQQLHFKQLFTIYHRWQPSDTTVLSHVWFGMILGPDNKPFKTRTGENIELGWLLNEAEERAFTTVTEKNPEMPESERREIARVVGIGAVKYSDLLPNRQSDYVFSWDKMLALQGNTAPYLQYAYTRIRSVFRKAAELGWQPGAARFALAMPEEIALAKHLLRYGQTLEGVLSEYRANYLCNYLYDLAGLFARFYENCPILKSEGEERNDRLALCELAGRVLKEGLNILGIETTEKM